MGEAGPVTSFPDELGKRLAERWLVVPEVLIEAGVVVAGRFGGGLVVARANGWHRCGDGDPRAVGETEPVTPFFDELGKKRDEPWLSRWGRARCLIATVAAGRGQVSSVTPFSTDWVGTWLRDGCRGWWCAGLLLVATLARWLWGRPDR
ncbi:hypothetical protein [Actinokineospora fastidiosa]|uniref:Uncharacterized protein n=1 Tax=Actinokineospora fastidiosa TaxID=1816 RepID=A0A918LJG1_9PSEU|nr:hypothetical protein [Actinokineospora fastidiosa]GGS56911.1 hypothetical protein GCM10010171_59950 [Actinokineospora fastidiosa]